MNGPDGAEAPFFGALLAGCIAAAERAGEAIRTVANTAPASLGMKLDGAAPRTEANRAANRLITSFLARWPAVHVVSKDGLMGPDDAADWELPLELYTVADSEAATLALRAPYPPDLVSLDADGLGGKTQPEIVVWVNALSGTEPYATGNLESVTVLIGIAVDGVPRAGVMHQPWCPASRANPLFAAERLAKRTVWGGTGIGTGSGVHGVNPPLLVAPGIPLKRVLTSSQDALSGTTALLRRRLGARRVLGIEPPWQCEVLDGCGNAFLLLLERRADGYVVLDGGDPLCRWDTCAAEALIAALGGQVTSREGAVYYFGAAGLDPREANCNTKGTLATMESLHHRRLLEQVGGD